MVGGGGPELPARSTRKLNGSPGVVCSPGVSIRPSTSRTGDREVDGCRGEGQRALIATLLSPVKRLSKSRPPPFSPPRLALSSRLVGRSVFRITRFPSTVMNPGEAESSREGPSSPCVAR